jgi:hypothetical protein
MKHASTRGTSQILEEDEEDEDDEEAEEAAADRAQSKQAATSPDHNRPHAPHGRALSRATGVPLALAGRDRSDGGGAAAAHRGGRGARPPLDERGDGKVPRWRIVVDQGRPTPLACVLKREEFVPGCMHAVLAPGG